MVTIIDCYNSGKVSGGKVGGIVGQNAKVFSSYNTGDVKGNSSYSGGIIGHDGIEIVNCYNTGTVWGQHVAGICGMTQLTASIINCYNIGKVQGTSSTAGIVGWINGSNVVINNCFNTGELIHKPGYDAGMGGIVGKNAGTVTINNCYNMCEMTKLESIWASVEKSIVGRNTGTVKVNKCYYMPNSLATSAIQGKDDSEIDVVVINNKNELTAEILNGNINTIEHEEEWKMWEEGKQYPILKL